MPVVLRQKGYRFFFFSREGFEPAHVHVEKSQNYAKFWLSPVSLARSKGFRSHEIAEIQRIIEVHIGLFKEKWDERHRG
jgi:hypothetical protein